MRSPARLTIATRSRHGTAAQAGCARRAAATASSTSASVPLANVPTTMSRVDRRAHLERAGAVAPGAVDVVPVRAAERARAFARAGLELRVELLVVGAQRRVGDLDSRCGLGGHGGRGLVAGRSWDECGLSLARPRRRPATAATASGSRPPRPRPGSRASSSEPVLAGEHEDAAQAGPLAGQDVGPDVVADHRDLGSAEPRPRARRRVAAPSTAIEKNAGAGLPMICARTPAANSRPVT